MIQAKLAVKKKLRNQLDDATRTQSDAPLKKSVDLAKEKGAPSWANGSTSGGSRILPCTRVHF